jgi:hypothetical protein
MRLTWSTRLLLSSSMIRHRRNPLVALMSLAVLASLTALTMGTTGCEDHPVGRICDLGAATPQADEVVVASPSLDCVSRTCLHVPLGRELPPGSAYPTGPTGLCTAECTVDSDCDRVPESPCITGFTCGIPPPGITVQTSPFCCRKFCICKDYIVVPDSGVLPVPEGCDPTKPENKCCNLPGRENSTNPDYALCKT